VHHATVFNDGGGRFIARAFDCENFHMFRLAVPAPAFPPVCSEPGTLRGGDTFERV
jgi:hypothetical protein